MFWGVFGTASTRSIHLQPQNHRLNALKNEQIQMYIVIFLYIHIYPWWGWCPFIVVWASKQYCTHPNGLAHQKHKYVIFKW